MEVKAITKYIRISPKKARLVADIVRSLNVEQAENQLRFIQKKASRLIVKTLKSAVANAEHNFGLKKDNLYIKKILINEGPALKRWTPKAFGSATPIKKRSSHIEIILDEIKPSSAPIKKTKTKIQTEERESLPKSKTISEPLVANQQTPSVIDKKAVEERPEIFDQRRAGKHRTMQRLIR